MKYLGCFVLAASVSCGSSRPPAPGPIAVAKPAEPSKPVIPDTAAGHTMAAWLDAFNSGDAARLSEFVNRYKDPMGRWIASIREVTGGFDVVAILKSAPRSITFVVKEKASTAEQLGFLRVASGDPAVIERFTLVQIPRGMTAADIRTDIDAETPSRIVNAIDKTLNAQYVYPAVAKVSADQALDKAKQGATRRRGRADVRPSWR